MFHLRMEKEFHSFSGERKSDHFQYCRSDATEVSEIGKTYFEIISCRMTFCKTHKKWA